MMTTAPVSPPAASTATAESPTGADPALAGLFGEELAQLLLEEQCGDDDEALAPEALALLLSAVADVPPTMAVGTAAAAGAAAAVKAAATAAAHADSPLGGVTRRLELQGASIAPAESRTAVSIDEMLQALRTSASSSAPMQVATAPAVDPLAGLVATHGQSMEMRPVPPHIAARHDVPLQTPVGSHAWGDELASRIATIATDGLRSASVRLAPEHLGPLDIRISVQGDEATVSFSASHADTRAALEHALPRLREMLASQGLLLTQADVSGHDSDAAQTEAAHHALRGLSRDEAQDGEEVTRVRAPVGLLDLYV